MSSIGAYVRERVRSKGVLNVLSAASRTYAGGAGLKLLSDVAWLQQRLDHRPPDYSIVAIETMSGCNYRCSFCPIGKVPLPSGKMELDLYLRILKQLRDFDGEIHPFLMNEPLLDKRIVTLCRLAREHTRARVVIQTNGSRLTRELAEELTRHATVIVNDYTEDGSVLTRLNSHPLPKGVILISRDPRAVLSNRAGNVQDRPLVKLSQFCIRPFTQLYIAHDGRVVLCCQDWSFEEVMGDANHHTLEEIWNGDRYRSVRERLLHKQRCGLCSKCDFSGI